MKQTDKAPEGAVRDFSMPRFLRGFFRSHRAASQPPTPAPSPAVPEVETTEASEPEPQPILFSRNGPPKVLVVDDDPVFLKAMDLKLSKAGCHVLTAHDGPEAITAARTANPDLIILDIGLPSDVSVAWDGIRVMQWIKRLENGSAPPIIIVTASGSPELKQSALDFGAVAFFQKPFDHVKFWAAIKAAVENRDRNPHPKPHSEIKLGMM